MYENILDSIPEDHADHIHFGMVSDLEADAMNCAAFCERRLNRANADGATALHDALGPHDAAYYAQEVTDAYTAALAQQTNAEQSAYSCLHRYAQNITYSTDAYTAANAAARRAKEHAKRARKATERLREMYMKVKHLLPATE